MTSKEVTEVPLTRLGAWMVGVPVRINNRGPWDFMIDSGSGTTTVDARLARELGLIPTGKGRARDAFVEFDIEYSQVSVLEIGGLEFSELRVIVEDMSQVSEAAAVQISGAIGHDILSRYEVTFDVPSGSLRLRQVDQTAEKEAGGLALFDDGDGVFLTTEVGGIECRFLVDVGAGMCCLQRSSPLSEHLEKTEKVARAVGPSGIQDHPIWRLRVLRLDEAEVREVEMVVGEFDLEDSDGRSADGLLGLDLISKMVVIIDYPGGRIRFRSPRQESAAAPSNS